VLRHRDLLLHQRAVNLHDMQEYMTFGAEGTGQTGPFEITTRLTYKASGCKVASNESDVFNTRLTYTMKHAQ